MRMRPAMLWGAVAVITLAASACSRDEQAVVVHKPGVYKGSKDPLVEKQGSAEQQETLLTRFKQVQTDR